VPEAGIGRCLAWASRFEAKRSVKKKATIVDFM